MAALAMATIAIPASCCITDAPPVPLLVAWPRRGEHPWVKEFVRLARHAAESGTSARST